MMLKERLLEDMKVAMREKQTTKKNVIQMVRAAILQVEKDKQIELEDDQIIEIIAKESKKRKDSLGDYEKSGRQDLINQIHEEITILAEYLPQPLSREEIEKIIEEVIVQTQATSMKDMGRVMKAAKEKIGVAADGKIINEIVKEKLA
ncbi:MAG: GatB/YqeY domain-containing protein [Clostridia bacterium]